jgi:hypothetical protein
LDGHACSGYAFAALRELSHAAAVGALLPGYLSAAYLWTQARIVEGHFPLDFDIVSLADCASVIQNYGVCPESFFPDTTDPSVAPESAANTAAAQFKTDGLASVSTFTPAVVNSVLSANPAQGLAVGIDVYDSFESVDASGMIPMPGPAESLLGGHVVLICGFDPVQGFWIVRNSQGASWGAGGYGYMPYAYASNWHEAWTMTAQS